MKIVLIDIITTIIASIVVAMANIILVTFHLETIGLGAIIGLLMSIPIVISTAVFLITKKKKIADISFWSIVGLWLIYLCLGIFSGRDYADGSSQMSLICLETSIFPAIIAFIIIKMGQNKLLQRTENRR